MSRLVVLPLPRPHLFQDDHHDGLPVLASKRHLLEAVEAAHTGRAAQGQLRQTLTQVPSEGSMLVAGIIHQGMALKDVHLSPGPT